jgi:hypothetical protein
MVANDLISWDIYEIRTEKTEVHGVMLRGRIRKLGLENNFDILCENASDKPNAVRFAVQSGRSPRDTIAYLRQIIPDVHISLVLASVKNPVLSKLKVNNQERYEL